MSALTVGDHDPIVLGSKRLGCWVECECGWIGPSMYSEDRALAAHAKHESRANEATK